MWIFKKIDCGLKVVPLHPEVWIPGVPATRGTSFEHRNGHECTDPKFHRHCVGRWRGSASLGFDADGNRIRRRVTGSTKTAVLEAMAERTKAIYKDGLAPLLAKIGHRPLREMTDLEARKGLQGLSGQLSTRSLQIARNALERALRFAQVHERVGRNVAVPVAGAISSRIQRGAESVLNSA